MNITTTSLDALPTGNHGNNVDPVQLTVTPSMPMPNSEPSDKPNYENELITSLQKAVASGMTSLPSRDIPMHTNELHEDERVKANYIPKQPNDYIQQQDTIDTMIQQNANKQKQFDHMDDIYNVLSLPFTIAMVYFIYQLPVVRLFLLTQLPFCYGKCGDVKLIGRIVESILFGLLIYVMTKFMHYVIS
uniref:Uncharacterized protein n=1 Tax=viral metagenome TaxID=1070528 RepID=A0A6C0JVC0_9ZZZZ